VERLLDVMRSLLASGEAREDGRVTVDRRDAVRIVAPGWKTTLVVDAETFEPIEWSGVYDDGTRETNRFQTYERLSATEANLALLSLTAQHPGATFEPGITVEGFGPDPDKSEASADGR
jgi:hypothetical protein